LELDPALLYSATSIFASAREFTVCPNSECRNFFNIERKGQAFCDTDCSCRHRQRDYWSAQAATLRKARHSKHQKMAKKKKK
jgi:hypothetical protein